MQKQESNDDIELKSRLAEAERALLESEQRFKAIGETYPIAVGISEPDGSFKYINKAYEQVFGYTLEEINQINANDLYVDPKDRQKWLRVIRKQGSLRDREVRLKRKDGTSFWAIISVAPILYGGKQAFVGSVVDISEMKCREDEIRQLNRTLTALSNSNQAMLHASNEQEFLNNVCRIIINDCGFAMTWIGYAEDDQQKSVRPMASAGFEQGYLEALNITWAETERGMGPTGTAIRTMKPARCDNMLTEPKFAPWREAALKRGYASSIVLPLISGEHAFGALNIYAKEPDGFSDAEEKLLVELATDISFGIVTLRFKHSNTLAVEALYLSEERYRGLFDNMTEGFALHEIICDATGIPCDYRFLEINQSFERITGLTRDQAIGRLASEVLPGLEPFWTETYGKVALTGQPVQLENYTATLGRYYRVYAYRPAPQQFAVIFSDITEAVRTASQLAAVADKYSSLFNTTSDGIWIHNLDGKILEVNEAYCQMSGYACDELIDMPISLLEQDTSPRVMALYIKKLIKGSGHDRFESKHRRKDGSIFDVDITALYFDKTLGRIAIFVRDITDRKRVEERLAYLASFPERNPHLVVEVSLEGEVRYANTTAVQLFPDLKELKSAHPWLEDWETISEPFRQGETGTILRDVTYRDHCYQQSLTYIHPEGVVRIYGIDISSRKRAEEALRQSEERYRTIVETAAEGIVMAQPDGKYTYVNQQMANLLGYTIEEMLGKSGTDFMYGDQQPQILQLRNKMHRGDILRGEFKFRRKDGPALWSMFTASPIFNDQGEHIANLSMHTDITERKRADDALRQARDELEKRFEERTHELNIANNQLRAEVAEREKAQTDLESNVQELQVIEEELRNNNELLLEAQKVLDAERQRYHDLFEFAPDGYLVTAGDGQILEANQFAAVMLAISHRSLIGKPLMVFVSQSDRKVFSHLLATLESEREIQSQELKLIPRHGKEIISSVKVAPAKDPTGKLFLRWTIRDISERKRNEEIIRRNAQRNSVISEVSQSLANASLDEKAILDIVAETTSRLVGDSCILSIASEDGKRLNPVAWHHIKPDVLALMNSFFSTPHDSSGEGFSDQVFYSAQSLMMKQLPPSELKKNIPSDYHKYIDLIGVTSVLVVPILAGGKTIGTLSITRDKGGQPYTEDDQSMLEILATRTGQAIHNARLYHELQDALRKEVEVHDQLVQSEKFAAVGRLLASITHEINNPLQTIKNCLYLSQMDVPAGTPASEALNIATSETNRLSNLVAQLREIYRPPAQGLSRPVDLPKLVSEVQVLLASYLQEKQTQWELTEPDVEMVSRLKVEGVPDQLKQVFLNICLNAIDAMEPQGGKLKIDFKISIEDAMVGICFKDTGPGLPPEVKEKLFEPFITTKEKGLGLGLVICYDIIQKHMGRIDVESEPREGAAFTIWLPGKKEGS